MSLLLTGVRRSIEETPGGPTLLGDHSLEPISAGILDHSRGERMDLKKILNMPKLAKKAARFIILTRLLGQYGAISENEISQGEH